MEHRILSPNLNGKRILVAEDDAIIAMLAESIIHELGGESVGCARTCDETLAALQRETFDLLILDVTLADSSSESVLEAAIEQGVPVLISSGHCKTAIPAPFRTIPLLAKPWTSDEFGKAAEGMFARTG